MLQFIRDRLAPGGIVYASYNSLAGWAAMVPAQRLMRLYSETRPGPVEDVLPGALGFMNELIRGDAAFFAHNPLVAARLDYLSKENPHYLAHELLNGTWEPMFPDAVARDMAEAKCGFIGSATLLENIDALSVPPAVAAAIADRRCTHEGGAARSRRLAHPAPGSLPPRHGKAGGGEVTALLDDIVLAEFCAQDEADITIATGGSTSRTLDGQVYGEVQKRLRAGSLPVGELRRSLGDLSATKEIVSVLCETERAHPLLAAHKLGQERAGALNRVIGRHNRQGGALKYLLAPKLGTGLPADTFETVVFEEFSAGLPDDLEPAIGRLLAMLVARGLVPQHNGVPTDPEGTRAMLRQALDRFIATRLAVLQQVGILPGS